MCGINTVIMASHNIVVIITIVIVSVYFCAHAVIYYNVTDNVNDIIVGVVAHAPYKNDDLRASHRSYVGGFSYIRYDARSAKRFARML